VQSYYRREYRRVPRQLTHHVDVFDVDAQHALRWGSRHEIVWGGGVRVNKDGTRASDVIRFDPADRTYGVQNAFVQDEVALVPGRLSAILGVKYEHNAFSGGELQPNVRARVTMARNQVLWGGFSRAVRRPTRFDDDLTVLGPGGVVLARGSGEFEAEKLNALELGYRVQPVPLFSIDLTVFRHRYHDLRSQEPPATGVLPITIDNTLAGRAHGLEAAVNLQPAPWWRTHVGYTWLDTTVERQPGSRDVSGGTAEINDPDHILTVHSAVDLSRNIEVDARWYAVGALPDPAVPAYHELALRGGWRPVDTLELFVVGEDLLHARHPEAGAPTPARIEFERAVRVGATVRF
jgi:iron complex outermembrane receptor protein